MDRFTELAIVRQVEVPSICMDIANSKRIPIPNARYVTLCDERGTHSGDALSNIFAIATHYIEGLPSILLCMAARARPAQPHYVVGTDSDKEEFSHASSHSGVRNSGWVCVRFRAARVISLCGSSLLHITQK